MGSKKGARAITKEVLVEMSVEVQDMFEAARQLVERAEAKEKALDVLIAPTKFSAEEIVDAACRKPVNQEKIDTLLKAYL
jgi:F0F1-type ATP synthase membrane subunit b/b'